MNDRINDGLLHRMIDGVCDTSPTCSSCEEVRSWGLSGYPLAMVYAPMQDFTEIYDLETALDRGTVFSQLDLPFMGMTVTKGGKCHG